MPFFLSYAIASALQLGFSYCPDVLSCSAIWDYLYYSHISSTNKTQDTTSNVSKHMASHSFWNVLFSEAPFLWPLLD